jgi:hypothetical protein
MSSYYLLFAIAELLRQKILLLKNNQKNKVGNLGVHFFTATRAVRALGFQWCAAVGAVNLCL